MAELMSERERIARLIRMHPYNAEHETCRCILAAAVPLSEITPMSMTEHSLHVADFIQWRKHCVVPGPALKPKS